MVMKHQKTVGAARSKGWDGRVQTAGGVNGSETPNNRYASIAVDVRLLVPTTQ